MATTVVGEVDLFRYRIQGSYIEERAETRDRVLTIDISVDHILKGLHLLHDSNPHFDKIIINFPDSVELTEKFETKQVTERISKGWS